MGLAEVDVPDEGGFFEDILVLVDLVTPTVDDGDGEPFPVFENHHDRHGKEAIDLAGDGGEFAACVFAAFQLDSDENVGLKKSCLHRGIGEEAGFAAEFLVGELKEKVRGLPFGTSALLRSKAWPESKRSRKEWGEESRQRASGRNDSRGNREVGARLP